MASAKNQCRVVVPLLDHPAGGNPEIPAWCRVAQEDERLDIVPMSSLRQIVARPDVLYVSFPEWLIRANSSVDKVRSRSASVYAALRVARHRGMRIVWHANNLIPHETDGAGVTDRFLQRFSALVDALVASSQSAADEFISRYPMLRRAEHWIIPMGDYRPFYSVGDLTKNSARAGLGISRESRVALSFGMIRRYKNQVGLIEAFRNVPDPNAVLIVAGHAGDPHYLERLRQAALLDDRVLLRPGFLSEEDLLRWLIACDFTVLSAAASIKSGTAMMSLSFDRPVVVPARGEFIDWRDQLGEAWVMTYDGGIRTGVLDRALHARPPGGSPPLSRYFDWASAGTKLAECFLRTASSRTGS